MVRILPAYRANEHGAMIALDYSAMDDLLSADLPYLHSTGVVESKPAYPGALQRRLYEYAVITRDDGDTQFSRLAPSRAA